MRHLVKNLCVKATMDSDKTVHSASIQEVHNVPFHILIRPFPPVLDQDKVKSLMATLQVKYFFIFYCHNSCKLLKLFMQKYYQIHKFKFFQNLIENIVIWN